MAHISGPNNFRKSVFRRLRPFLDRLVYTIFSFDINISYTHTKSYCVTVLNCSGDWYIYKISKEMLSNYAVFCDPFSFRWKYETINCVFQYIGLWPLFLWLSDWNRQHPFANEIYVPKNDFTINVYLTRRQWRCSTSLPDDTQRLLSLFDW